MLSRKRMVQRLTSCAAACVSAAPCTKEQRESEEHSLHSKILGPKIPFTDIKPGITDFFCHLGAAETNCEQSTETSTPFNVDVLTNSCLFAHPAVTDQHKHSF